MKIFLGWTAAEAIMKVALISDVHANLEALTTLPETYDELWVLGDLVNYGPDPAETIEFIRSRAAVVIRGNHDHSVGWDEDPRCSPRFTQMAEETRQYSQSALSDEQKAFLRRLPLTIRREIDGVTFFLCHATPIDPLYEYRPPDSPHWRIQEDASAGADIILVGHTHLQFVRSAETRTVVNPGSLGQSKHGDPSARYAVWEDGGIELKSFAYPVERTIAKIQSLPLSASVKEDLAYVLGTGTIPPRRS
jgi:protein phosphatase